MFGGGEEYFQDPPEIDRDTLRRFATFCGRLRGVEKAGRKTVSELAALGREVGDSVQAYELVVGALFRHIKSWSGTKQLACWYILDKMCKEDRDKYAYTASKYILEIGRDYIPYEDPTLGPKYESLVEHWENVFPRHVVDALWLAKKERLWAVQHPSEILQQQAQEEAEWAREEAALEDVDGLNDFGQPCMDYLQGRCTWGDQCRLYHPPGEEGTLPPECRMGDWRCAACGVINRHFRRRCSNCVREKPQYKRERAAAAEDVLLSSPDPAVQQALRRQFGYDPYDESEAVAHWAMRLESTSLQDYLDERRAAYKVRILGHNPATALEQRCSTMKHYADVAAETDGGDYEVVMDDETQRKRSRGELTLPLRDVETGSAMALVAQMIVERGVRDAMAGQLFGELARHVRRLSAANTAATTMLSAEQATVLLAAAKLGYTAWNTNPVTVPFVASFFKAIRHSEDKLGLSAEQQEQLVAMARHFVA